MAQAMFHVFTDEGEWLIHFNEKFYGPFDTRQEAVDNAIEAAQEVGASGLPSQVVVKTDDGWHPEWTYGTDPGPGKPA